MKNLKFKGTVSSQQEALKGKLVRLRMTGKALFATSGQILEVVEEASVTNGIGTLEGYYPMGVDYDKAVEAIGREISSPSSYSLETEGYIEVHPASIKVR